MASLHKFQELEKQEFQKPLMVGTQSPMQEFPAFIDVENKFSITDKLSQVNTLLQMENIASYPFMTEGIRNGDTMVHAMWFDIFSGEIQYFSRKQKVKVNKIVFFCFHKVKVCFYFFSIFCQSWRTT